MDIAQEKFLRVKLDGGMIVDSSTYLVEMEGRLGFMIPEGRGVFDLWFPKDRDNWTSAAGEMKRMVVVEGSKDMLDGVSIANLGSEYISHVMMAIFFLNQEVRGEETCLMEYLLKIPDQNIYPGSNMGDLKICLMEYLLKIPD